MSSYTNTIDFCDFLAGLAHVVSPTKIVEFGILNGHSIEAMHKGAPGATIEGYDIFDEFNGNHANKNKLEKKFETFKNIFISFGNFYKSFESFENSSIDILHIDIANDGDVYEYAIDKYMDKIRPGGCIVLEGGTSARDSVEWMKKYNKRPIRDYLEKCPYNYHVVGEFPGLTIIKK